MPDLHEIENLVIDDRTKGVPGGAAPFRLGEIGAKGWNLLREDLPLPLAVLKDSALAHNGRWMRRFVESAGALFAPHGKTTMSPQLFQRQLDDGAWAITVATVQELQVCRRYGFPRLLMANQLLGRPAIRYVLDELRRDPDFEFYCLVDSVAGVEMLAREAADHPVQRPLTVLLEGGFPGGRTGCRDLDTALAVGRAVRAASPRLALAGVEGFEGLIPGASAAERADRVSAFLDYLVEIAGACDAEDLFADGPVLLSAGGSAYYDLVAERFGRAKLAREARIVTRSGCYLTHDSAMYVRFFAEIAARRPELGALGEGLRPALEVWAYVQSRPEPGKCLVTMGRRDVSSDADMPVPRLWYRPGLHDAPVPVPEGPAVVGMNDQHTHLAVPADAPFAVGDMLGFGISHPCTTFDKWDVMPVVDDGYTIVSAIKTFF